MIEVRQSWIPLADWIIDISGLRIGVSQLSLLTNECYLWVEVLGPISRATLREAKREMARFADFKMVVNVNSRDPTAVRFAEFFGFVCSRQIGPILVMEKN